MCSVPLLPPANPETRIHWLLHTLCKRNLTPATDCSKALRGLLVPLGDAGLFVQQVGSPGYTRGQRGPRGSIHARRNLHDKAFGYLERVRVTPVV
jgi:hypothetical protein